MQVYRSQYGQSIFDITLQLYVSLDYTYKLIQDNGIDSINTSVFPNLFVWDDTLVQNQQQNVSFAQSGIYYSTLEVPPTAVLPNSFGDFSDDFNQDFTI